MKKIGTVTFHAAHNFGSNLQAYALQEYIKKISKNRYEYKIINLRTNIQKQMYTKVSSRKGFKNTLKRLLIIKDIKQLNKKYELFEKFIIDELDLTKEYSTLEELKKEKLEFDYYISGSDQLWNLSASDFDWTNYLEFVDTGKRISYAASFGPKSQEWNKEQRQRIKENLLKYDFISVREQGSFENVKSLCEIESNINVDPTMLLEKEEWLQLIPKERLIKGDYILLYNLKNRKETFEIAKYISKKINMPVVIPNENFKVQIVYNLKKYYASGPIEFLNLINNAKLVLSSSFHGTVFSILLQKPFLAIDGMKDLRITTLLTKMKLENRSVDLDNIDSCCENLYDIDFKESEKILKEERKKSELFLKEALDIQE